MKLKFLLFITLTICLSIQNFRIKSDSIEQIKTTTETKNFNIREQSANNNQDWRSALSKVGNAISSGAKSVANAVVHPIDTAKAIGSAVKNVAEKVEEKVKAMLKPKNPSSRKTPPAVQKVTTVTKKTKSNDYGSGATIFLERHNIDCQQGALTGFVLKKDSAQKMHFDYTCSLPEKCTEKCLKAIDEADKRLCKTLSTKEDVLGNELGNSADYLEKHEIKCPEGFALKAFKLDRVPPKVKYTYTCCPGTLKNAASIMTTPTAYGDFSTGNFENQHVKLQRPDEVITGFHLIVNKQKKSLNYKVEYAQITG